MPINSHFIQKALIKSVFKKEKIYHHSLQKKKIKVKKIEFTGAQENLFNGDEEFIADLEKRMNQSFESKVASKVFNENIGDSIIFTYEDSILLRKYLLITLLRSSLHDSFDPEMKDILTKLVSDHSNKRYEDRFVNFGIPIVDFFMHNSTLKFIKHKETSFVWPMNYFYTVPFDSFKTDFQKVSEKTNGIPGFLFRLTKNHSIMIQHRWLSDAALEAFISSGLEFDENSSKKIRELTPFWIAASRQDLWITNKNMVIHPDGSETNATKIMTEEENNFEDILKHKKEIINRDKKEYSYRYKVLKMPGGDYEVLILNNINRFIKYFKDMGKDVELYLTEPELVINLFQKWLDIEKYVSLNNPEDVLYWGSKGNVFKHVIWETMLPHTIDYLKEVIKCLEGFVKK